MVDLPSIPLAIPRVTAPTPAASPGDIAAPFANLAKTLDVMGEQIQKNIAEPFAEKAGREAVRTGPDGQLIVDRAPIFGPASEAYSRAARFTYLAQVQPKVENKMTELRLAHPNDPEGFQNAAGEYVKTITGNIQDDALRGSVEKLALENASHNYRTSLVQADTTNRQNALESLQARLVAINDRGASLARQGGTDTPEYAQLHADRAAIYKELTGDARFKFPKERADLELKSNRDVDVIEGTVGRVLNEFKTKKNLPGAQKALQEAFWGPGSENLSLTPTQRNHGVSEGLRALERAGVEDKVATSAFQSATTEYVKDLQRAPANFDEGRHNDMVARARELGDYKSIAQLDVAKQFTPFWGAIKALPPPEQARVMADISKGVVPALPVTLRDRGVQSKIEAEATRLGVPPQLAVAVAAIESGGNPLAVSKAGYRGIYQMGAEEFARAGGTGDIHDVDQNIRAGLVSLKAKSDTFAKEFGRPPSATELYLMHQQGEAGARAHLANPELPAWVNMLNTGEGKRKGEAWAKAAVWGNLPASAQQQFGTVENVTSRDFVGVWTQKVQGIPYQGTPLQPGQTGTAMVSNPYVYKMWEDTVKSTREQLGKSAGHMATQIITQANDGNPVPPATLSTFVASAVSSGNDHLLDQVRSALAAQDARAKVRAGGPSAIAALDSEITAVKANGADPVQYETLKHLQAGIEQDAQAWHKDPLRIGTATKLVEPVHQIDTANPANAAAEFAQRETKLKLLQGSGRGVGPASVLTGNEGDVMKNALVQGDPAAAGALLGSLSQSLSPENYRATLASPEMKEALSGMIRSRDPTRMTAGFAALDKYWNQDPWGFKSTFGDATLNHLQAWQGLKDSFTAPEIAERLNKSEDPSLGRARADLKEQAHAEMKTWQAGDVSYQLGTSFGIPLTGPIARNVTGSTPAVPFDTVAQRELVHDFSDTYTALRTYGVDADKARELAAKRVKSEWGASPSGGNRLMKYPPESYYKPVDGSHAWLAESLRDTVTAIRGPQVTVMGGKAEFQTPNLDETAIPNVQWKIKGLVADSQTQAEIAAGKPPSYRVALDTFNGMTEFLSDPKSGQQRWAFNDAAHLAASRKRLAEKETATKLVNDALLANPAMP